MTEQGIQCLSPVSTHRPECQIYTTLTQKQQKGGETEREEGRKDEKRKERKNKQVKRRKETNRKLFLLRSEQARVLKLG